MTTTIIGIVLIILIILAIYVIYKLNKNSKLKGTETFKTRIEKGEDIFRK